MVTTIDSNDIKVDDYLVQNSDGCQCGRYFFYSEQCGHLYIDIPHKCGKSRSRSGNATFCIKPAYTVHMDLYK